MKARSLATLLVLFAASLPASLVPVGPVQFSGTGLGSVNTVLTVGATPTESGCVARGPSGDVVGPAACPAGFAGGDERTGASQTQTRTISQLGLTTATDLRVVLNVNESTGNSATLPNLVLTIYSPTGTLLFTSGPFVPPTFLLTHSPGTTVGYVFELDATQAAQAQLVFAGTNSVGLAATVTNTTAGPETFFVADVTAVGAPLFGADLALTKAAPATIIAGADITYTINAVNNGPDPATNVIFSDTLPPQTPFVSWTAPAGWACTTPPVGGSGTITCTKASMALAETATFTGVVHVCAETACGTVVTNTASIASSTIDPVTANGSASASTTVQAQSDLAIVKGTSAASVNPGGTLIYTLTVDNLGLSNSVATSVIDNLPAGFTAVSVATSNGTCTGIGTATVTCSLGTIGAPAQCVTSFPTGATITITAQTGAAIPSGTYTNTATVSTGNCVADPNVANNTSTINTTVPAGPVGADIAVSKTAPTTAIAGTNLTYTSTVTNSGPAPATNVVVTDPLPAQTRFVSETAPAGWTCTTPPAGGSGTISCTKSAMAVAEAAVFTTVVRLCPETLCGAIVSNTATATAAEADPLPANNSSTASTNVEAQSDVAITKGASPSFALPGTSVTYTLNVANNGPSNSASTTVLDTLPAGFIATSVTTSAGSCTGTGSSAISCTLGALGAAGQCATTLPTTASITITAQVPAAASGTFVNTSSVATGNCLADPNMGNNTATAAVAIGASTTISAPTLSEWGLMIFGSLLLLVGAYFMKK